MSETVKSIKAATINKKSDPIWVEDYQILFKTNRLNEFFPTKTQTNSERLNSIVRLGFYVSVLLCIYHSSLKYSSIFVFILIFTFIINKHHPKQLDMVVNNKINLTTVQQVQLDAEEKAQKELDNPRLNNFTPTLGLNESAKELGILNGVGGVGLEKLENDGPDLPIEKCTMPTVENPFGNFTMTDMMKFDKNGSIVDRPPACDANDPSIKKKIDKAFNNNLFKDVNDVFSKGSSQRQFFTMPWTEIVNDRDSFQKWLYLSPETCKQNQENCLRYEDLRSKRFVQVDENKNPNNASAKLK